MLTFNKGPLFFSDIPYDSIVEYISENMPVPKTLNESYKLALSLINQGHYNIPQPIDDWIQAYTLNDHLNDFSKGYLHIYGYDSYNTLQMTEHDRVLIKLIREKLNLTVDMPDELVLMAILNEYDDVKNDRKNILRNYDDNNKSLAHLGDRVAEIILTNMTMKMNNTCYDEFFSFIQDLVSNETFKCFMNHKYLCEYITKGTGKTKACPDLFEAIIGAIYYWYNMVLKNPNTLELIEQWLIDTFNMDVIVKDWFTNGIKPCDTKLQYAIMPSIPFTKIYKEYILPKHYDYTIVVLTEFLNLNELNVKLDYMLFELLLLANSSHNRYYDQNIKKTSIIGCVTKKVLAILGRNVFKMVNAQLYYELSLLIQPVHYIYPIVDRSKATKCHELFSSKKSIQCYLSVFNNSYINQFIETLGAIYYWVHFIHKMDAIKIVIDFMNINLNYTNKIQNYIIDQIDPCTAEGGSVIPAKGGSPDNKPITKNLNDLAQYMNVISFDKIILKDAILKYEGKYDIWTPHKILTIISDKEYLVEVHKNSTLKTLYDPTLTYSINVDSETAKGGSPITAKGGSPIRTNQDTYKTINKPRSPKINKPGNKSPTRYPSRSNVKTVSLPGGYMTKNVELENIIMNLDTADFTTIDPSFNVLLKNPNYWEKLYKKYFSKDVYLNISYEALFKLNFSLKLLIEKLNSHMTITKLYDTTELFLNNKKLKILPSEIGVLRNLRFLDLSYNELTSLPKEIGNLISLQFLDLSHNQLTTLPEEIGNLFNLVELSIKDNPIKELPAEGGSPIPESIDQLTQLKIKK